MPAFLKWNGEKVKAEMNQRAARAITKACINIESMAKKECPVSDGILRSSIHHEVTITPKVVVGKVGSDKHYAKYVELGTHPHLAPVGKWAERHGFPPGTEVLYVSGRAQPFLIPSWEKGKDWRKFL